jgi:hypothetical protein
MKLRPAAVALIWIPSPEGIEIDRTSREIDSPALITVVGSKTAPLVNSLMLQLISDAEGLVISTEATTAASATKFVHVELV